MVCVCLLGVVWLVTKREIERVTFLDNEAKSRTTASRIHEILDELSVHSDVVGRHPNDAVELRSFAESRDELDAEAFRDGWGRDIQISLHRLNGRSLVKVASMGANGTMGDSDDITKWFPVNPEWVDVDMEGRQAVGNETVVDQPVESETQ